AWRLCKTAELLFSGSCTDSGESQRCKQNTFETQLAPAAIKPFLQGVRAPTRAAAANRDGFAAERQRNIRVGRSPLNLRGVAEVRVYCPYHMPDPSIRIQFSSGRIAHYHTHRAQPGSP